ncbi:hypothetical protein TSUD_322500 [Trifolium subterraneum]|uniref:DUF6821 domain-containing protein n=1 Tax=Trifolium subterraneum TaxID=3900 RepID=A0A2Z6N909_TRISU|nr:hypothetical protein TSUD_322500 [Trifolium subterraneum]
MDINEWVILSDDSFFNGDEKQIRNSDSISVFDKDYFCTSPKSSKTIEIESPKVPKLFVHVPIQFEPKFEKFPNEELVKENTEKIKAPLSEEPDQDSVSQVFFNMKENKFVDMKLESPKSSTSSGRGFFSALDAEMEIMTSPRMKNLEKEIMYYDEKEGEDMNGGFNFWKWSLTGVGAICSFGVAAATICVLFFGSQQKNNKLQLDQKIRFQIYTDDKRIKQVVHHATKLNEAFAAARGVPLSRAHITYGGHYDGV